MKILEENIFATSRDRNSKGREDYIFNRNEKYLEGDLMSYGYDYFDNKDNGYAYSGYIYDGRFDITAKRICQKFNLKSKNILLEIGCAKGFLLKSFSNQGLHTYGMDYSPYAVKNCHPDLKDKIIVGDCAKKDNYPKIKPDFIICKETLPHLLKKDIKKTIKNMNNIVSNPLNILLQIQYVIENSEIEKIMSFDPTHKTIQTKEEWIKDLYDSNYNGYVHFKRLFSNESEFI